MIEERDDNFKLLTHKNKTVLKTTKSEKGLFGKFMLWLFLVIL